MHSYTAQSGLPYFDRAAVTPIGCCWCGSLLFSTGVYERKILFSLLFCKYCSKLQTVNEKKLCFGLKKIVGGDNLLLRSTEKSGGRGNPFSAIGVNAYRTTNFRSRFAMRGAEIHGNMRRDGTTRILSIHCLCNAYLGCTYPC